MAEKKAPKYLETYATVAERLAMFWMEHPLGMVNTANASYPDDNIVRVRAVLYRWDEQAGSHRILSTGQAEEIREGYINESAATENCETSAVGRALALAGYGINKGLASAEEIELAKRRQRARADAGDEPTDSMESTLAQATGSTPAAAPAEEPESNGEPTVEELVKRIVTYCGNQDENPDEYETRKEFVKAKFMSLGVENPVGVRESLILLSTENKAALAEWLIQTS